MNQTLVSEGIALKPSVPLFKVYKILYENPKTPLSGADISRNAGVKSGTVYALLLRLEELGLVQGKWEDEDPKNLARPRRKLFTLTAKGFNQGHKIYADFVPVSLFSTA